MSPILFRLLVILSAAMFLFGCKPAEKSFAIADCDISKMTSFEIVEHLGNSIAQGLRPGLSTDEINLAVESFLGRHHLESYFRGYHGYPGVVSISVNEEVLGAVPSSRTLKAGDLVKIETGIKYGGQCAYFGWTVPVGMPSAKQLNLLRSAERALDAGCAALRVGGQTSDVTSAIDQSLRSVGLAPNKDFVGYRIGELPHMSPPIPGSLESKLPSVAIKGGATFVILVIAHDGNTACRVASDRFTILSNDKSDSVLLSRAITLWPEGPQVRGHSPLSFK